MNQEWVDTHTHIGCNDAVGYYHGANRGDCVRGLDVPPLDLCAILVGHYVKWSGYGIGYGFDEEARKQGYENSLSWARKDTSGWWRAHWRIFKRLQTTGVMKSIGRGLAALHNIKLVYGPDFNITAANAELRYIYENKGFYQIWKEAADALNCRKFSKMVELPWYTGKVDDTESAAYEDSLITTALRCDSFTTLHIPREYVSFRLTPQEMGLDISGDLSNYLEEVVASLERAKEKGMRAAKNAYAYFGPLALAPPDYEKAELYYKNGNMEDYRAFESVVYHRILEWVASNNMPYQMHAGMVPVPNCDPSGLAGDIAKYKGVLFHLLHIYPYAEVGSSLAKNSHNAFLDPCWQSLVSPDILRRTLDIWLGFVPPEKILWGIDATTVEEWYGGALFAKEVLADVLCEKVERGESGINEAEEVSRAVQNGTGRMWYG